MINPNEAPDNQEIDLLAQWVEAMDSRTKEINERHNNIFAGRVGIEELLERLDDDISLLLWFLDKSIKKSAMLEDRISKLEQGHISGMTQQDIDEKLKENIE